jgi:hypothetical protein
MGLQIGKLQIGIGKGEGGVKAWGIITWENAFSQLANLHLYGFSPVCVRICCCRCESCVN